MTRLARFYRRWRAERDGEYVTQLKDWAEREPVIRPLALPQIRPLVAVPAARVDRVTRFRKRNSQ